MKNTVLVFLFSLLFTASVFSQSYSEDGRMVGGAFRNRSVKKVKVIGSPYQNPMFASAKVGNIAGPIWMRYSIYNDEFEFITPKNDTLIADKIEDFSDITFGNKIKYKLITYTNRKNQLYHGYLITMYQKGDYSLFKKENITFVDEKIAKTTLETNMPAKYVKSSDTFYLKNKNFGITEFPDGKKALIKLNPGKKELIENFIKENKISFDEQSDMIKIVDFLAGL